MSGFDSLKGRVILFPDAKMDYSPGQIKRFIDMWNEGWPIGEIAKKFWLKNYEVVLLIIHCELEGWIGPREGGLQGTLKRSKRKEKGETG